MAQTLNIPLALGSSKAGLNLRAQLFDDAGANVGAPVTTGFSERGGGSYVWHYAAFPDDFTGGVDFFDDETDEFMASTALNTADFGSSGGGGGATVEEILGAELGSFPSNTPGGALQKIGVGVIKTTDVVTPGGDIHLFVGDSYLAEHNNALEFTDDDGAWPDLTDLNIHFFVQGLDIEAEAIVPTGPNKKIRVELHHADTIQLEAVKTQYAIKIIYEGESDDPDEPVTIVEGRSIVKKAP
jgi:hypothetical protein